MGGNRGGRTQVSWNDGSVVREHVHCVLPLAVGVSG